MAEILHSATEELLDAEIGEVQGRNAKASGSNTRSIRQPAKTKSSKPLEAAQDKMRETRMEDQKGIRERAERIKTVREQRFERLLEDLLSQDELKCSVASMIRQQHQREFRKQANIYSEWNERVFGRIQGQLHKYLNPPDRGLQQALWGSKTVGFKVPGEQFRPHVSEAHDPAKRQLHVSSEEDAFRRTAESIVSGGSKQPTEDFDPLLAQMQGDEEEQDGRARSRPVLDPTKWGQLELQATPYGHFAQAAEASATGLFRTQLKQGCGVFIPSEKDGVPSAGKRRTRFERNNLGILQGELAQRGETIQFKDAMGGGIGAPAQDHYLYETGTKVTDKEFPLGKKMFSHMH